MKLYSNVYGQMFVKVVDKLTRLRRLQLVQNSASSLAIKLISVGLSFILAVALARTLGPVGFGRYSYVYSFLLILAIPAQLGLPQLVVRETAKADIEGSWGSVRGLWRWSNAVIGFFSAVIVVGVVVVSIYGELNEQKLVLLGVVLVPLVALGNIRGAALRGLGRVVLGQLPETVLRPLLFVGLILAFNLGSHSGLLTPEWAMFLHVLAAGLAFLFGVVLLSRSIPDTLRTLPQPIYHSKHWISAALPLGMISGIQIINSNLDIVMLGIYRSTVEVGIYKVAVTAAALVAFGLQAINLVIMPRIARLFSKGDIQALQTLVTSSARIILVLAVSAALIIIIFGSWILDTAFGPEYADGYGILVVLVAGQLANSAFGSVAILLNMGGYEKVTLIGVLIAAFANVALNILLIPHYGGLGAAIATSVTLIVWNAVLCWCVYTRMGVVSTAIRFRK